MHLYTLHVLSVLQGADGILNTLIYASDPEPIPDEELLQFKNLCVCSVYTSAILNSKIKGNKNEHTDLFTTLEPILTRLKIGLFCRICSWSHTLAS